MLLNPVFINMLMATGDLMTIKDAVAKGLYIAVKYAKGKCVYITPTKILELAGSTLTKLPRAKVEARNILNNLCMHGLTEYVGFRAKSHVYCITEKSPLWGIAKNCETPEDVLRFIEEVIK